MSVKRVDANGRYEVVIRSPRCGTRCARMRSCQRHEGGPMTDGSKRQSEMTLVLMLALTFSTGIVDAVGYLGLDKVFAGNMTGNVVILGMAIVGADGLPWVGPLVALIAFMVGAVIGGRTLRRETI